MSMVSDGKIRLQAECVEDLLREFRDHIQSHTETLDGLMRELRRLDYESEEKWAEQEKFLMKRFETEKEAMIAEWEARRAQLLARYEALDARCDKAHGHVISRVKSIYQEREDGAKQKYQQTVWASSSGYSAGHSEAAKERDKHRDTLAQLKKDFEELDGEVLKVGRQLGLALEERDADDEAEFLESDEEIAVAFEALEEDVLVARQSAATVAQFSRWTLMTSKLSLTLAGLATVHLGAAVGSFLVPMEVGLAVQLGLCLSWVSWLFVPSVILKRAVKRVSPIIVEVREQVNTALSVVAATLHQVNQHYGGLEEHSSSQRDELLGRAKALLDESVGRVEQDLAAALAGVETKYERVKARIVSRRDQVLADGEHKHVVRLEQLEMVGPDDVADAKRCHDAATRSKRDELELEVSSLRKAWEKGLYEMYARGAGVSRLGEQAYPALTQAWAESWQANKEPVEGVVFGQAEVNLRELAGRLPDAEQLKLNGAETVTVPAVASFPTDCSVLVESGASGREEALALLRSMMLRILLAQPPGKVSFTIVDPIGLGESFGGFMHLADHDERFVGRRIWVESRHIEQQLADLNEHIEKVIQKYLRNEFATIAEFNASAGEMAERFRFLVICDFPTNFSEAAAQRLASVINSGPRCGVFVLMHKDRRQKAPRGLDIAAFRKQATWLNSDGDEGLIVKGGLLEKFPIMVEPPPEREVFTKLLQKLGASIADATRVEVPFAAISPPVDEIWSRESSRELRVPIGKAGASKAQELLLGHGTSQHVLVAGKTGSGKSTMFHVLIGSLALWYGPDQVEFYLIDFKKGVEFKCYASARLPHLRAVAIESDREFGLSILARVDDELKTRGHLFRDHEVQDLHGYREASGKTLPRTLLIIDEFQELFVSDDRVSQEAALLLDRIVRQGRAFGIHVLLGSQTLGGAYSLARTTMGQMTVRIALQCSEADSYLILNDDNAAARLLSRPGEAIYNDSAGMIEGNSPFQVTWLPDSERDESLLRVRKLAEEQGRVPAEPPIIFEGNALALLENNRRLMGLMNEADPAFPEPGVLWLGEPNTIKEPTQLVLRRQTGCNLALVGQNADAARAIFASSLVSLAAQQRRQGGVRVYLIDGTPADMAKPELLWDLPEQLDLEVKAYRFGQAKEAMAEIRADQLSREGSDDDGTHPLTVVMVYALHRFKPFREEDDFSFGGGDDEPATADKQFAQLLANGPELGMHVVFWCDSLNNLGRTLSRKSQGECEYRVLFQMSASDSTTLVDHPGAGKLGIHWAMLYGEQEGALEKFRPYRIAENGWGRD